MDGTAFWVVVVEHSRNLLVVFVGFVDAFVDVVKHSLIVPKHHQTFLFCAPITTNNLQLLIVPCFYNLLDVRELLEL